MGSLNLALLEERRPGDKHVIMFKYIKGLRQKLEQSTVVVFSASTKSIMRCSSTSMVARRRIELLGGYQYATIVASSRTPCEPLIEPHGTTEPWIRNHELYHDLSKKKNLTDT